MTLEEIFQKFDAAIDEIPDENLRDVFKFFAKISQPCKPPEKLMGKLMSNPPPNSSGIMVPMMLALLKCQVERESKPTDLSTFPD